MRKISRYILAVLLMIMLCVGCSTQNKEPAKPLPSRFESDFNADMGELKLSGHITKNETGMYIVLFTQPQALNGLTLSCIGSGITATINGISIETDMSALPQASFLKSVVNALDTLAITNAATITRTDNFSKHEALSQSTRFYALTEQSSGNIVSLVIESSDISMTFSNFTHK